MVKNKKIEVAGKEISIISQREFDYISLTDMAKHKNEEATGLVISHWLSTKHHRIYGALGANTQPRF